MIEKWENYTIKQSLESISPDFKRNAPKKEITPEMVVTLPLIIFFPPKRFYRKNLIY